MQFFAFGRHSTAVFRNPLDERTWVVVAEKFQSFEPIDFGVFNGRLEFGEFSTFGVETLYFLLVLSLLSVEAGPGTGPGFVLSRIFLAASCCGVCVTFCIG